MQPTQKPVIEAILTPADHLRHAALYLRHHGWTTGEYFATPPRDGFARRTAELAEPPNDPATPASCCACGNRLPLLRSWGEPLCENCVTLPADAEGVAVGATSTDVGSSDARTDISVRTRSNNNSTPRACVHGAITMAVYGTCEIEEPWASGGPEHDEYRKTFEVFRDWLFINDLTFGDNDCVVHEWNDHVAASVDEVIEALTAAANEWDRHHLGGTQ